MQKVRTCRGRQRGRFGVGGMGPAWWEGMTTTRRTPAALDARTSATILAIRAQAGNACTRCPTCGRTPGAPYRVYGERGHVVVGCVDAAHHGHLVGESARWHARPEAQAVRRAELAWLRAM
jgi:hypothetical protein